MNADTAGRELHDAARRAARLHVAVRAFECAAAGVFGGAIVLAAGLASGAEVERDLTLVVAIVAIGTAILVWREHPPLPSDVVSRADRAAHLEGALPAALDATRAERDEQRASSVDLAAALASRVRAVVGPRQFARAAWPRSPLLLAAPLVGAALVAFAWEAHPRTPRAGSSAAVALRDAAAATRAAGAAVVADELEIEARRLEAVAPRDPSDPRGRTEARALLERLAERVGLANPARAALEQAAARLDAGLETVDSAVGTPSAGSGVSAHTPAVGPLSGSGARAAGTSNAATLANGAPEGRMFGPPAGGESHPDSGGPANGTPGTGGPGRGAPSARWWPSRYDDVVARYLAR